MVQIVEEIRQAIYNRNRDLSSIPIQKVCINGETRYQILADIDVSSYVFFDQLTDSEPKTIFGYPLEVHYTSDTQFWIEPIEPEPHRKVKPVTFSQLQK